MINITVEATSTELYYNLDTLLALPPGTIINELDDTPDDLINMNKLLFQWQVKSNKTLDLVKNHYDYDRSLSKAEIDRIKPTKLSVAKYFVEHSEGDGHTYGEFSIYSDAEYKFFKHVTHAGHYYDAKPQYNSFHIRINKDQSIKPVINEVNFILALQAKRHPKKVWIRFDIFEHNLSAGGSYSLMIHRSNKTCKIEATYSEAMKFENLEKAMEYIKNNLWYEEVTSTDEDDE